MDDLSILGTTEEAILTNICRCAARYVVGEVRPKEELTTQAQQEKSIEMQRAIYIYLHQKVK